MNNRSNRPSTPETEEMEALLAAYALGERDDMLCEQVVQAITTSDEHRDTLVTYLMVADLLPLAVPDAPPTVELRDRVLATVTAAQNQPAAANRLRQPSATFWQRWFSGRRLGYLAAALLLVFLLGWNIVLQQQVSQQQQQLAQQTTMLATLAVQPDAGRIALSGRPAAPDAAGSLVIAEDEQTALLLVQDLPPLSADQTYQVWLFADERALSTSGGLFQVDETQSGALLFTLPPTDQPYEELGVTIEPQGGSPAPTTPWLVGAELPLDE